MNEWKIMNSENKLNIEIHTFPIKCLNLKDHERSNNQINVC